MLTKVPPRALSWSLALLLSPLAAVAQVGTQPGPQLPVPLKPPSGEAQIGGPAAGEAVPSLVRRYPQDRDVAVAVVANRPVTLGDLVDHLDAVHHPGFRQALGERPEVQRMLQSDLIAPWVRQYADILALKHFTKDQDIDPKKLEAAQSDRLKGGFQAYLEKYVAQRRDTGRPTELSQKQINSLLARYQLDNGLACEMQGWLDHLEPGDYPRGALHEFYQNNARAFGGTVTMAHILIPNRDQGTGILLDTAGMAKAEAQLADVRARLRSDGSNFDEVAKLCSADAKTAPLGGLLGSVHRFDDRLPAVLCRAAWRLRDGEVSDVVESQYGWHLVKRLDFQQHIFVLFTDDAIPSIQEVMRRARQEDLLFAAREKAAVKLML